MGDKFQSLSKRSGEMRWPLGPGAGDSHVGAVLAALSAGRDLDFALDFANQVSSQIVQTSGVRLSDDTYQKLRELFHEKE